MGARLGRLHQTGRTGPHQNHSKPLAARTIPWHRRRWASELGAFQPAPTRHAAASGDAQSTLDESRPPVQHTDAERAHRDTWRLLGSETISDLITAESARPDLYISADVETDGRIPGPFSMLSFGLTVVGSYAGDRLRRVEAGSATFYRELRPISDEFEQEALDVNGLDRNELSISGTDPATAMDEAAAWVLEVANGRRPVLVAYPVAFDWSFLYWYFERFAAGGSPFGFSSCLDIRTLYQAAAGTVHDASGKRSMPSGLLPTVPHTHNALDDALEQGELFANVFEWVSETRGMSGQVKSATPEWLKRHLTPDPRAVR